LTKKESREIWEENVDDLLYMDDGDLLPKDVLEESERLLKDLRRGLGGRKEAWDRSLKVAIRRGQLFFITFEERTFESFRDVCRKVIGRGSINRAVEKVGR
jgi:hypothetical protein